MQTVERVGAVIYEVDTAILRYQSQAKETAGSGGRATAIKQHLCQLLASWCCLHNVTISAIHSQNIAIRSNRQAQWAIYETVRGHILTCEGRCPTMQRIRDSSDAIVYRIRYIENIIATESDARWPDDQGRGVCFL